jgi:thiamine biosynthesis lipoprotein
MGAEEVDPPTATAEWTVWSTTVRVVVMDPAVLDEARGLVADQLAAVDAAASRFRDDSELRRLVSADGAPRRVSALLAELVAVALEAAVHSDGAVDPTLGGPLAALGYDRDIALVRRLPAEAMAPARARGVAPVAGTVVRRVPAWTRIVLDGAWLTVPAGIHLDLGATAKAHTADRCAALVAGRLSTGVLVSLGGDIATAGSAPAGGWQIRAQDRPGEPTTTVTLAAGGAVATSSTLGRRWWSDGRVAHHVLDPRTCQPAEPVWRTVTVAADTCLAANTASTASLVKGAAAPGWLRAHGLPARLVHADGSVLPVAGWPADEPAADVGGEPPPAVRRRAPVTPRARIRREFAPAGGGAPHAASAARQGGAR